PLRSAISSRDDPGRSFLGAQGSSLWHSLDTMASYLSATLQLTSEHSLWTLSFLLLRYHPGSTANQSLGSSMQHSSTGQPDLRHRGYISSIFRSELDGSSSS